MKEETHLAAPSIMVMCIYQQHQIMKQIQKGVEIQKLLFLFSSMKL